MRRKIQRIVLGALLGLTLAFGVAWAGDVSHAPATVACGIGGCGGTGGGG